MSLFQSILGKITESIKEKTIALDQVSFLISKTVGITITPAMLSVSKGVLRITTHPTVKMEIITKKEKILSLFKENNIAIFSIV